MVWQNTTRLISSMGRRDQRYLPWKFWSKKYNLEKSQRTQTPNRWSSTRTRTSSSTGKSNPPAMKTSPWHGTKPSAATARMGGAMWFIARARHSLLRVWSHRAWSESFEQVGHISYIYFLEILAQLIALLNITDSKAAMIISFIDNKPGCFALQKGYCKDLCICNLVSLIWRLASHMGWHIYLEWVASEHNISDQVSRHDFSSMHKIGAIQQRPDIRQWVSTERHSWPTTAHAPTASHWQSGCSSCQCGWNGHSCWRRGLKVKQHPTGKKWERLASAVSARTVHSCWVGHLCMVAWEQSGCCNCSFGALGQIFRPTTPTPFIVQPYEYHSLATQLLERRSCWRRGLKVRTAPHRQKVRAVS